MKKSFLLIGVALTALAFPAFAHARVYGRYLCAGPRVRPSQIVFTCADSNFGMQSIHWRSWGGRTARGRGVEYYNDCNPFCAAGQFHYRRATITLYRIGHCRGYGRRRFYTRARVPRVPYETGVVDICPIG